jgi:hypothetical protein
LSEEVCYLSSSKAIELAKKKLSKITRFLVQRNEFVLPINSIEEK